MAESIDWQRLADAVEAACAALMRPGESIEDLEQTVPARAGLYVIHGSERARQALGLEEDGGASVPLYVGKAERSLRSRDLRGHFSTGKTGSSTVRRSLAALLSKTLDISARPRNPDKPERFSNYGLEAESDARLTEWMGANLTLAYWVKEADLVLDQIETAVISRWQPVLNLDKVLAPDARLKSLRAVLATQARQWAEEQAMR
ncbi:MAG: hypothetical protein JWP57_4458 [Spirosoma sp.]|nr:hypothetical protein [Spirosoma sp.]